MEEKLSFWQLLALIGVVVVILGIFTTIYGIYVNKGIKEIRKYTQKNTSGREKGKERNRKEGA